MLIIFDKKIDAKIATDCYMASNIKKDNRLYDLVDWTNLYINILKYNQL